MYDKSVFKNLNGGKTMRLEKYRRLDTEKVSELSDNYLKISLRDDDVYLNKDVEQLKGIRNAGILQLEVKEENNIEIYYNISICYVNVLLDLKGFGSVLVK